MINSRVWKGFNMEICLSSEMKYLRNVYITMRHFHSLVWFNLTHSASTTNSCNRRAKNASSIQYMAIENVELVHEFSPDHWCIGTARLKYDKETGRMQAEKGENGKK